MTSVRFSALFTQFHIIIITAAASYSTSLHVNHFSSLDILKAIIMTGKKSYQMSHSLIFALPCHIRKKLTARRFRPSCEGKTQIRNNTYQTLNKLVLNVSRPLESHINITCSGVLLIRHYSQIQVLSSTNSTVR